LPNKSYFFVYVTNLVIPRPLRSRLRSKLRLCVFLYRGYCTVYWFAPQLQTREKHKATQGEAAGVYTGVPGERRLPRCRPSLIVAR
jgi:hypothetical protein